MSKRPAARWPCVARLSFLFARQPVTRRAKACGRCPIDGGVREFPLQRSEACRKRQKTRKRGATPTPPPPSSEGKIAMFPSAEVFTSRNFQSGSFANRDEGEKRRGSHRHFLYTFLAWLIAGVWFLCRVVLILW